MWGGLRLFGQGIIRTEADVAVTPARRNCIQDAFHGIEAVEVGSFSVAARSNCEYYISHTDFLNNGIGLIDLYKGNAKANEGVRYSSFSMDMATVKAPYNSITMGYHPIGIKLQHSDQPYGSNNYAAASIDHCSFHDLYTGIEGVGQLLRITDNTFDHICRAAINTDAAAFYLSPMYIERNTITVRGQNIYGYTTSYGILGDAYTSGNYISGDAANPTVNMVQQVGISIGSPTGATHTNNTLVSLDRGIEASADAWMSKSHNITGNLFRNVREGVCFFPGPVSTPMQHSQLTIRCNTFENPASVPNAVGLKIDVSATFPYQLGTQFNPNGNRFGTAGVPVVSPVLNRGINSTFTYFYYSASTQEVFPASHTGYTLFPGGGNLASACVNTYNNGINARIINGQPSVISLDVLRKSQDSLHLTSLTRFQQNNLLTRIVKATEQQADYTGLETFLNSLPDPTGPVHAALGSWLLQAYYAQHLEAEAARIGAALLHNHAKDAEVKNVVQLANALQHIRGLAPLQSPHIAHLATLRRVAASGTAAAFQACRVIQQYEPCACRLPATSPVAIPLAAGASLQGRPELGQPYPNPANDKLRVDFNLNCPGTTATLELRDGLGRLMQQQALSSTSGEADLMVSSLAAGLYNCVLVVDGHVLAARQVAIVH